MKRLRRYALTFVATTSSVTAVLLLTGWGSAIASTVSSVLVTNTATNPVPVREQNVDKNGFIAVHEQGTAAVHEQGTANVNVANTTLPVQEQGTVMTQPADPPNAFSLTGVEDVTESCAGGAPAGATWHISSFSFSNAKTSAVTVAFFIANAATADTRVGPQLTVPAGDMRQMTFPQPFTLTAPTAGWCLVAQVRASVGSSSPFDSLTVVGYRT